MARPAGAGQLRQMKADVDAAGRERKAALEARSAAERARDEAQADVARMLADLQAALDRTTHVEEAKRAVESELAAAQDRLSEAVEQQGQLGSKLEAAQAEVARLGSDHEVAAARVSALEQQNRIARAGLEDAFATVARLEREKRRARSDMDDVEQKLAMAEQAKRLLRTGMEDALSKVGSLEKRRRLERRASEDAAMAAARAELEEERRLLAAAAKAAAERLVSVATSTDDDLAPATADCSVGTDEGPFATGAHAPADPNRPTDVLERHAALVAAVENEEAKAGAGVATEADVAAEAKAGEQDAQVAGDVDSWGGGEAQRQHATAAKLKQQLEMVAMTLAYHQRLSAEMSRAFADDDVNEMATEQRPQLVKAEVDAPGDLVVDDMASAPRAIAGTEATEEREEDAARPRGSGASDCPAPSTETTSSRACGDATTAQRAERRAANTQWLRDEEERLRNALMQKRLARKSSQELRRSRIRLAEEELEAEAAAAAAATAAAATAAKAEKEWRATEVETLALEEKNGSKLMDGSSVLMTPPSTPASPVAMLDASALSADEPVSVASAVAAAAAAVLRRDVNTDAASSVAGSTPSRTASPLTTDEGEVDRQPRSALSSSSFSPMGPRSRSMSSMVELTSGRRTGPAAGVLDDHYDSAFPLAAAAGVRDSWGEHKRADVSVGDGPTTSTPSASAAAAAREARAARRRALSSMSVGDLPSSFRSSPQHSPRALSGSMLDISSGSASESLLERSASCVFPGSPRWASAQQLSSSFGGFELSDHLPTHGRSRSFSVREPRSQRSLLAELRSLPLDSTGVALAEQLSRARGDARRSARALADDRRRLQQAQSTIMLQREALAAAARRSHKEKATLRAELEAEVDRTRAQRASHADALRAWRERERSLAGRVETLEVEQAEAKREAKRLARLLRSAERRADNAATASEGERDAVRREAKRTKALELRVADLMDEVAREKRRAQLSREAAADEAERADLAEAQLRHLRASPADGGRAPSSRRHRVRPMRAQSSATLSASFSAAGTAVDDDDDDNYSGTKRGELVPRSTLRDFGRSKSAGSLTLSSLSAGSSGSGTTMNLPPRGVTEDIGGESQA